MANRPRRETAGHAVVKRFKRKSARPEELAKAGATEDMVWLSIGIEHIDDILADLEHALAAA